MFPGGNLEMQGRNVTDHNLYNDLGTSTAAFLLVSARYMHFYSATANGFMQTSDISRHNVIATCSPISQRIFCIHHCTDFDYKLSNSAFIILFATPQKNQTSPPGIDPLVVFFFFYLQNFCNSCCIIPTPRLANLTKAAERYLAFQTQNSWMSQQPAGFMNHRRRAAVLSDSLSHYSVWSQVTPLT